MNRRKFIQNYLPAGFMVPSFMNGIGIKAFDAGHTMLNNLLLPGAENDRVLVLVQLTGGNDGLNTVIPIEYYSNYANARKNIKIAESAALRIGNIQHVGLHPAMTGMQQLFNDHKLTIVQSVGYPQPNFSHFRATDIWMSASSSNEFLNTGWLGRLLDETYPGFPTGYPNNSMPDPLAIQIGSITSLSLQGPSQPMGMSISNTTNYYSFFNNQIDPAPASNAGKELTYVREIAKQTQKYGDVIKNASSKVTQQSPYPTSNSLADQLKIVARLIKGGLKTKIYLVSFGGFDTHSAQAVTTDTATGTHARLLKSVSDAIKAFQDDLKFLGVEDRVMGMTFSEFGRRILSNGSNGTDHGAAAPLFIFGSKVNHGVLGKTPLIPTTAAVGDNIPYQYDFRSIYASLLSNWLCVNANTLNKVMLKNFQDLPLTKVGTCSVLNPVGNTESFLNIYPNPFHGKISLQFKTEGGHTLLQILDGSGRLIKVITEGMFDKGTFKAEMDGHFLSPGIYYIRLQNELIQEVKSAMKY